MSVSPDKPLGHSTTPFHIFTDFDGTITVNDTLNLVVQRYAPEVWERIEVHLQAGRITLLEAMEEEFRHVRAPEEEVVAHVVGQTVIREGFREFVEWCERGGHQLVVVSAGFRVLIDPVLARAGLDRLHVHSGDALFSPEGTKLSYPPAGADCIARCGHCKSETIRAHGPFRGPVVHIGDGYSDRCAAREADVVFARSGLAHYLEGEGIAYHPYEDFFDVVAGLESLAG